MCTNFLLQNIQSQGYTISARTLDFGIDFPAVIRKYRKGDKLTLFVPEDEHIEIKHNFICVVFEKDGFNLPGHWDGINEAGLSGAALWLPETKYQKNELSKKSVYMQAVVGWALSQFETIEDLKTGFDSIRVVDFLPLMDQYQPFHYVFHDKNGESLVVEFKDGERTFPDDVHGVLTNFPFYEEQLKHLDSEPYKDLRFQNYPKPSDQPQEVNGSGMLGLPGDSTPKSRFVRAAELSETASACKDKQEAVTLAWQVLETLQVPQGTVLKAGSSDNTADYTQWMVIRDHGSAEESPAFYFYSVNNPTLFKLDLKDIKWDIECHMPVVQTADWCKDVTDEFNKIGHE